MPGRIKGYDTVANLVGARKGQSANISLATHHTATYFNILAPGKTDEAFFNGPMNDNQFEGALPATAPNHDGVLEQGFEITDGAHRPSGAWPVSRGRRP